MHGQEEALDKTVNFVEGCAPPTSVLKTIVIKSDLSKKRVFFGQNEKSGLCMLLQIIEDFGPAEGYA